MPTLVIDFRMHRASGIGTYITSIVPHLLGSYQITLLGDRAEIAKYCWANSVDVIDMRADIYGVREQLLLFWNIPYCDYFWSPHWNCPVLPVRAKKRIVTIHDVYHLVFSGQFPLHRRLYARWMIRLALARSDLVLTVSEFSKSEIKKYTGHRGHVEVVNCGVGFKAGLSGTESEGDTNVDTPYIIYVGNVKPHKNLRRSLEAFNSLPARFALYKFVIVGKMDSFITGDDEFIKKAIADRRVLFTGYVSERVLIEYYRNATCLLFCSIYEGFGLPPLEAQICGTPCLVSNVASMPEVCGDSVIYCDPFDSKDIAEKLTEILSDWALQEKLVNRGYINVERFSWPGSASKIKTFIDSIL